MSRVVHFEIHAAQPERAIAFYSGLLGWQFNKWEGPMPYWLVVTGPATERGIDGGLLQRPCADPAESQAVNAYVCTADVPDLDAALAKAGALGGTVAVPRMPIPGVGWLAYLKDPEGNLLGLMQSDPAAA